MFKIWKPIFLLLFLTGCSGTTGAMLGSLFGAGAMYGGQAFLNRTQADVEAKVLHRAERKEIVNAAIASKRRRCEGVENSLLEFSCWKELLVFHDKQNPETLVMELKRRVKSGQSDLGAESTTSLVKEMRSRAEKLEPAPRPEAVE